MHAAWEVEEVRRLAAGTLAIRRLAGEASVDPRPADGTLAASLKRRSGAARRRRPAHRGARRSRATALHRL